MMNFGALSKLNSYFNFQPTFISLNYCESSLKVFNFEKMIGDSIDKIDKNF